MTNPDITYTTATELARAEGVTKQGISKLVKKFRESGELETQQKGREVFFDRDRFCHLRSIHSDPARAALSPARDDHAPAAESSPPAGANVVRTSSDGLFEGQPPASPGPEVTPPPSAVSEDAQRYQSARARGMELETAQKALKLKRELGQLVSRDAVDAEIQKMFGPVRAIMIDNAPDLARKLIGLNDEREITSAIREHYRFTLNEFTEKLRARDVSDSVGEHAGERGDGDPRSDNQSTGGAAAA